VSPGFSLTPLKSEEADIRVAPKLSELPSLSATTRGATVAKLDMDEFLQRFEDRAQAVRDRGVPPLEGEARKSFIEGAERDYFDYSLIASASWSVEDGNLVLRMPLSG
jgi:hypothetical protein